MSRSVLVTGGSSGIGSAIVRVFSRAGYRVFFTYRSGKDRAEKLVRELGTAKVTALPFDQGKRESHDALLRELQGIDLDVLINNAGLGSATVANVAQTPHEQDQALMQVNAVGVLWLTQALVPLMRKRASEK